MTHTRTTILENEFATVWCYPRERIIHHEFHLYCYSTAFQEVMMAGLTAFEAHSCTKWLSDDRHFAAMLPEDKEWAAESWRPRVLAAGWKYWAMILPQKMTGRMNLQRVVEEYEALGVTASYHEDPDAAMQWLVEQ